MENANTRIVAYFDSMDETRVCFNVNAIQTSLVNSVDTGIDTGMIEALIEVIDYYSPSKLTTTTTEKIEFFYILLTYTKSLYLIPRIQV